MITKIMQYQLILHIIVICSFYEELGVYKSQTILGQYLVSTTPIVNRLESQIINNTLGVGKPNGLNKLVKISKVTYASERLALVVKK